MYTILCTCGIKSPRTTDVQLTEFSFHAASFEQVPKDHQSPHSAWETPDPGFWTRHGYALVRGDEVGTGQSPGVLNTMSRDTSLAFKDLIEWAASQPWSSGKVGLL